MRGTINGGGELVGMDIVSCFRFLLRSEFSDVDFVSEDFVIVSESF
jgi:hypothetical protein